MFKIKNKIIIALIAFSSCASAMFSSYAKSPKAISIGIYTLEELNEKVNARNSFEKQLYEYSRKMENEAAKDNQKMTEKFQQLEKNQSVLSASALEAQKKALQEEYMAIQAKYQKEQLKINKAQNDFLSLYLSEIKKAAKKAAESKSVDLVLSDQLVAYHSSGSLVDLTNEMVTLINKSIKKVDLNQFLNS